VDYWLGAVYQACCRGESRRGGPIFPAWDEIVGSRLSLYLEFYKFAVEIKGFRFKESLAGLAFGARQMARPRKDCKTSSVTTPFC
jgi:hypothetical protein